MSSRNARAFQSLQFRELDGITSTPGKILIHNNRTRPRINDLARELHSDRSVQDSLSKKTMSPDVCILNLRRQESDVNLATGGKRQGRKPAMLGECPQQWSFNVPCGFHGSDEHPN